MLSDAELESVARESGLTPLGVAYLHRIRTSPPSRRVGGNAYKNMCVRYPSVKMGCVIQAESRSVEFAYVLHCEYDQGVAEYYDQLESLPVLGRTGSRAYRSPYWPDYLEIRISPVSVAAVQCKPSSEAARLVETRPHDWITENGTFRFLAAERAFEPLGIAHKVITEIDVPPRRAANIALLLNARHDASAKMPLRLLELAKDALERNGFMTLRVLANFLGLSDIRGVIRWIADRDLSADLDGSLLSQAESARAYADDSAMKIHCQAIRELASDDDPGLLKLVAAMRLSLDTRSLKEALERKCRLDAVAAGNVRSNRTDRRHFKAMQDAETAGLPRFCGLLSRHHLKGNRGRRYTDQEVEFLEAKAKEHWQSKSCPSVKRAHVHYCADARKAVVQPASLNKFYSVVRSLHPERAALARSGMRAAQAAAPPRHRHVTAMVPTYPWALAQCDHSLLDIYVVVMAFENVWYVCRPWLTVLVDVCTRAVLAAVLRIQRPDRTTCALILRACARIHGLLPEGVIFDGGAEFDSVFFEACLAICRVAKLERPKGAARYGSEAERVFGQIRTELTQSLPGSTENNRKERSASSDSKGQSHAVLTFEEFARLIDMYFDYRNSRVRTTQIESPSARLAVGTKEIGCVGRTATYNRGLRVLCSVEADSAEYSVSSARGIHFQGQHFWDDCLLPLAMRDKKVLVRPDPEDRSLIYAHVDGQWVDCRTRDASAFDTLDSCQKRIATIMHYEADGFRRNAVHQSEMDLADALRPYKQKTREDFPALMAKSDGRKSAQADDWAKLGQEDFERAVSQPLRTE
ncbi:hypothetical protein [Dokdonella soli]|uniref:hypothetical protein n=1 Tax=Dokdonella soli TaxID=529810 RepID=UPI0031E19D17